ncbi:MAG TPA: hypothetical protein VK929_00925 [Longimicrobiales bacterium]|nr:hypothetical protein [Longimicrobiales bacterium]
MRVFPASSDRPDGYPQDLPFVPGAEVGLEGGIDAEKDSIVLKWLRVERPLEMLQQLIGASVRDGWTLHDDDPPATGDTGSVRRLCFVRGARERVIEAVQAAEFSFVTLTDRPAQ